MYEANKESRTPKNKQFDTLRMSHFLHGCWGYHDWHGYLEAQDSSCHVYPTHINENSWAKPAFFSSIFRSSICKYPQKQNIWGPQWKSRVLLWLQKKNIKWKISQDSWKGISVLCKSPLVLCTRSIVIKHHLWQFLLRDGLVLADIGNLHF